MKLDCKNCNLELEINENSLFYSQEKGLEKANCPKCDTEVYQGLTDGWFSVAKGGEKFDDAKIVFPMP
jgi:hypothetical protein